MGDSGAGATTGAAVGGTLAGVTVGAGVTVDAGVTVAAAAAA